MRNLNKVEEYICPFCGDVEPTINYRCNTSGSENGYLNRDMDTESYDSDTDDHFDYEYEMDCCGRSVDFGDAENIYNGEYEIDEGDFGGDLEDILDYENNENDEEKKEEKSNEIFNKIFKNI